MRNLTEPLWNFSSAPCGRCLTRSLKLPRPAARVTPEQWFFRGCRHFFRLLRPTRQLALFPVHASRGRSTGREAFHEATQNRATTRPFVIGSGTSYCRRVGRKGRGRASRMERFSPDFWVTRFPGFAFLPLLEALMFLTCKSSTNTTAWFLLMSFEDLCRKSFLMLAILLCNLVIRAFALRQFLLNLILRVMRRCNCASFGRSIFNGWHWSTTSPLDRVTKLTTPQSIPTADVEGCCGVVTSRSLWMDTNHLPQDSLIVMFFASPSTSCDLRQRIQPIFGALTRPFWLSTSKPCGTRKL